MDERTHARYMSDIAYFLSKMEAEPNSGYFIPIALAYNKLEKYDETIAMCKSAIERFPANCAAKTFLAEAYVYKGQFDLARELLFDVTAEDDNNYKALKLLGIICKENGDTTDALKYLTGAYIRSPEDEDVKKMIEELGGSLNPAQIYDERMKRQSQAALDSEEDEELRTYQEIDQRIRNAEIIMADLVSDTTISARDYTEEEDFYSDDPNDFMPLITSHQEEEETISDDPNDFLPTINQEEEIKENNSQSISSEDNTTEENDLLSVLDNIVEENNADDLLSALSEKNTTYDEADDDLLSALSAEDTNTDNDLLTALSEENEIEEADDLLSALSNHNDIENNDLLSELSEENESGDTDILSELTSIDNDLTHNDEETLLEILETTNENTVNAEQFLENIDNNTEEIMNNDANKLVANNDVMELETEEIVDNLQESLRAETIHDEVLTDNIDTNKHNDEKIELSDKEKEVKDLYSRKIPSSVVDITYDDMIDDDFQYGQIVDENYNEEELPNIDLGESAPFTQGDIMDEILDVVGMTQDDMANDEQIELSDKERKLERLEQFLEKVRHNKETI